MSDLMQPSGMTPQPESRALPESRVAPIGAGWTWIADAFSIFSKSALMWIVFFVLFILINMALAFVPFIGQLVFNLVWPMIMAGVMVGCKAIEDGQELEIDHFVAGFNGKPKPLVTLGVLYLGFTILLIIVILMLVFATMGTAFLAGMSDPDTLGESLGAGAIMSALLIGLVALGLSVPMMMAFWFAVPLVYFHDVPPIDALKLSFFACLKNILPFLVYGIVMFVFLIVAAIPLGLGLLVFGPVMFATVYTTYKSVFEEE